MMHGILKYFSIKLRKSLSVCKGRLWLLLLIKQISTKKFLNHIVQLDTTAKTIMVYVYTFLVLNVEMSVVAAYIYKLYLKLYD